MGNNAIFITDNSEMITSVYSDECVAKLSQISSLDRQCYSYSEVKRKRGRFTDVEFIFTTWGFPKFSLTEIRDLFPSLKAVFYAAGSVKYFAAPFYQCGIKIFSSADANAFPVVSFVYAQIQLANKGYFQSQVLYKRFLFKKAKRIAESKVGNTDSTIVGLLGCGKIGSAVASKLVSDGTQVYVYDPYMSNEKAKSMGVIKVNDLQDIFALCDVVSNHMPDIIETKGIINKRCFESMKDGACFINTGRGAQVNEWDMFLSFLKSNKKVALLDVTKHEPLYPFSPLRYLSNIFVTPHIAGSSGYELRRLGIQMLDSFKCMLNSEKSPNEVTYDQMSNLA